MCPFHCSKCNDHLECTHFGQRGKGFFIIDAGGACITIREKLKILLVDAAIDIVLYLVYPSTTNPLLVRLKCCKIPSFVVRQCFHFFVQGFNPSGFTSCIQKHFKLLFDHYLHHESILKFHILFVAKLSNGIQIVSR